MYRYTPSSRRFGALDFGSLAHDALELRYPPGRKRGPHPANSFLELFDAHVGDDGTFRQWDEEGEQMDARELGVAMMEGYVRAYGTDPMLEVIAPEMTFEIDVFTEGGKYVCTLVGKFDAIVRRLDTGKVFILEHKTAKSIETVQVVSGYGEQALSYIYAATVWLRHTGVLKPHEHVDGVMFNFLRKALPDPRPQNEDGLYLNKPTKAEKREFGEDYPGSPSKRQPAPLFERSELVVQPGQLQEWQRRLRVEALEMGWVRAGKVPIYKNPTKDCAWDCDFRDVCEIHELGGDYQTMFDMEFTTWDPYSDHELDQERIGSKT